MKKLFGFAIVGVIAWYLWRNHFKALVQPSDNVKDTLDEVNAKNQIGDQKRGVFLANQTPIATYGDTAFAGIPLVATLAAVLRDPKETTLLPKGSSKNPFDRTLDFSA